MNIPANFEKITCNQMLVRLSVLTPGLETEFLGSVRRALGDAISVEELNTRIKSLERRGLVQFALSKEDGIHKVSEPAVFVAERTIDPARSLYESVDEVKLADALVAFWDRGGRFNTKTGAITSEQTLQSIMNPQNMVVFVQTPEGPMSIIKRVAERMTAKGLLGTDDQGRPTAPSKVQLVAWSKEHGVCDFCGDSTPEYVELVPDFHMSEAEQRSVDGWASCTACHVLIRDNKRAELLRRAYTKLAGDKLVAESIKRTQREFWMAYDSVTDAAGIGAALVDFAENRIANLHTDPQMESRQRRIEAIQRLTGLTSDETTAVLKGDLMYKDVARKLSAWRNKFGGDAMKATRKIAEMVNQAEGPRKPFGIVPHWQEALDQKMRATDHLKRLQHLPDFDSDLIDAKEDFAALPVAEVFSFNEDTIHAIRIAMQSIPHEAPLKSIEIPHSRAGWFWFGDNYEHPSSPIASDCTQALLWSWSTETDKPTLRFSTYVIWDKEGAPGGAKGEIMPAAKWYWPIEQSFHQMIGLNTLLYRKTYGQGGPLEDSPNRIGEEHHMGVVAEFSLFFLMSCLWFRQTVPGSKRKADPKLTQEDGQVQRFLRKRYEREYGRAPSVKVIALRKTERAVREGDSPVGEGTGRKLSVQFIVGASEGGFAKLQKCGPGLKDEKLIWIDPYRKGPIGAPWKESQKKVHAVVR